MRTLTFALLAAALAGAGLPGQRRFVVDANGNGQFKDLQAAIDAASAGDVLVVRPGAYTPFVLNKGLTIAAPAPGAQVVAGAATRAGSAITGIPKGQTARLVGLTFTAPIDAGGGATHDGSLAIATNGGVVYLRNVVVGPGPKQQPALQVVSSHVVIANSAFSGGAGGHGATLQQATVAAADTTFEGGADWCIQPCYLNRLPAGFALTVNDTDLHGNRVTALGGDILVYLVGQPGTGATVVGNSRVTLNASVVAGGIVARYSTRPPGAGLANQSLTAVRADRCVFSGSPPQSGPIDTNVELIGATKIGDAMRTGAQAAFEFTARPTRSVVLFASTDLTPTRDPLFADAIWLAGQIVPLFVRTTPATGRFPLAFQVPNDASLHYRAIWLHALGQGVRALETSAPVGGVILPPP